MNSTPVAGTRSANGRPVQLHVVPKVRPRVLVIDDDALVLETYRLMLRREFDVSLAIGGRAGLEQLAAGVRFDAIVCDLQMPDVDGASVLRHLRAHDVEHAARFIYCTGVAPGSAEAEALSASDAPVLHKPCTKAELVVTIRDVIGVA